MRLRLRFSNKGLTPRYLFFRASAAFSLASARDTLCTGPNPADVAVGRWNDTGPEHPGRIAHILGMFSPDRIEKTARRHLMRYVLPVPWLAEHWRE